MEAVINDNTALNEFPSTDDRSKVLGCVYPTALDTP